MNSIRYHQRGATLIISLIILVMMTLLAVTSFNLGKGSLQNVGNMQQRNAALAAAQETMELIVSSTNFFRTPAAIIPAVSGCLVNTRCIDSNGDGVADVTVTITPIPTCVQAAQVPSNRFSFGNDCLIGESNGLSQCYDTIWEVTVSAVDATTQAQYSLTQGVAALAYVNDVATFCPP